MKNRHPFIIILGLTLLFFTNCGETVEKNVNDLIGTWDYLQVAVSSCINSNTNGMTDYSENGDCESSSGTETCTKISLIMEEETYSIVSTTNTDGTEETETIEEGTYSITFGTPYSSVMFCTDIICTSETYIITDDILTLESISPSDGCNIITRAEKR